MASVAAVDPYFASQTPGSQVIAPDFNSFLAAATADQASATTATMGPSPLAGTATATSTDGVVGVDSGGYDYGVGDLGDDSSDGEI